MKPLSDLNHVGGVLNVLCVLLSKRAPVEDGMTVVVPQSKAGLYHVSKEVRVAVSSIPCNLTTGNRRLTLSPAMIN